MNYKKLIQSVKSFFTGSLFTSTPIPEIKKGQVYSLKSRDNNPFNETKVYAYVKDVNDGWVLYAIFSETVSVGGSLFQNESKTIESFLSIYKLKEELNVAE